ncbi:16S rRNA (cytosine(1402)-N(4))-methyltransferase RsmH [Mycoplasma enhydrae]|uniref:16S rRNA (cytosine(1402)-N(4))-methyltransferase RsmH n=1 Tax=Mycoplasma enhydrae TaxID=2499220 RepID=UPI0021E8B8A5|nr:16S rRNA (cytosine(1402)-N(4))-methyltransferase RsmH [Mycoplasma enhydrae]MCV3733848.1 16S rRNA (cytosine(1402)-N(4))-methyltransferase RsmH [Mycoplasma enhydrae]
MIKTHIPVLLNEVIESLDVKPGGIYVDLTLGRAGHSIEILKKIKANNSGLLICFDKDNQAIIESEPKLKEISNSYRIVKSDFRYLKSKLGELGITSVDGILADLGVSSPQLDDIERGFSYSHDTKLDMRMDQDAKISADTIINEFSEEELSRILYEYGDVKLAKLVAKSIIKNRPISTSFELNEIIKSALPAKIVRQKNPSKAIFQAIRIAVNDELGALDELLNQLSDLINLNGKIAIISFHSKEDVRVKKFFQNLSYHDPALNKIPIQIEKKWKQKIIFPSKKELEINKRAHSAKLRVITKIG